ncbi:MAG TPA: hypothetical protein VGH99_19965 [Pseudonocardia sp.]|jgi:hypothetical protein
MSRPRAPRIAGVAGGVGTTTLAAALRGYDRGRAAGQGMEVLVCRSTGESLHHAARVVTWLASAGRPRPVLAVTADQPVPLRGPLRARLRMIEPQVGGLVLVPYVAHWRDLTDPLAEAARLAECPADELPRGLRGYGGALAVLAEVVLRSGLLVPTHPDAARPHPAGTDGPDRDAVQPGHPHPDADPATAPITPAPRRPRSRRTGPHPAARVIPAGTTTSRITPAWASTAPAAAPGPARTVEPPVPVAHGGS